MPRETDALLFFNGLRTPGLDPWIGALSDWGLYAFPLALLVVFLARRTREHARTFRDGLLTFLTSLLVTETILKPLIARPRPTGVAALREQLHVLGPLPSAASTGMPSGTAAACMAGAVWIALRFGPRWGALAICLAVGLSLTRLYVGVHYPSDLVVGALVGAATAVGVDRFTRWAGA